MLPRNMSQRNTKQKNTVRRPAGHRPRRFEGLETRCLMAGDTYLINFQLADRPVPNRYSPDTGEIFGPRAGGLSYGWSSDHTDVSRDREQLADQRFDTLIHFHQGQTWELALANGRYDVTVAIGDAVNPSDHTLNVEGVNFWNGLPLAGGEFRTMTRQIDVSDGRLTLDQGAAVEKGTRIDFIHVVGVPSGPNGAPQIPTITEPAGDVVNPADVHMEAVGFSDPDGNSHKSSDWQIWTVGPGAELVWETLGIEGVERLHTHLGDGVFQNSHAGRNSLFPNTAFELRVRFRDGQGSVSQYATRQFDTSSASTVVPLLMRDIASAPAPRWTRTNSIREVSLPSRPGNQPSLTAEAVPGGTLLTIAGLNGIVNAVNNPATLSGHGSMRLVLRAGGGPLQLPATDLTIHDESGREVFVYLPAIDLPDGGRLDLWVANSGGTYFGTADQTVPDFSNLARQGDLPVPFISTQPGFVVEEVAGGFQLPTNIAFVPNPGSDPGDPLFYVTELYGTIKVVTQDFSVRTYASGLLNFNPTGSFPGSGEQGLTGIVVDPVSGDVFATRVTSEIPFDDNSPHHPQVVRFSSNDGGLTAATQTVILDMVGESQGQSHQISNVTIGPDGKLYVHNGDGFDASVAQVLSSYRGKVLRMNLDGTAPSDNPFYNAANGIGAADYVFAYGLRNPFGGAWRAADGMHYQVENGPSVDRLAQVARGTNYRWDGSDASMLFEAKYVWDPAHAPVNITFVQPQTFSGSDFPLSKMDHAFVSESGPTYAQGPQVFGKRIVEFEFDASGNVIDGPTTLVEYVGTGHATVVGLATGPDGLYFTELYKDEGASTPIDAGARVFRVRFTGGTLDLNGDQAIDAADAAILFANWGGSGAGDFNNDGTIDAADAGELFANWTGDPLAGMFEHVTASRQRTRKAIDLVWAAEK